MMILPGIGDSFVSARVRLLMVLGFSFVVYPLILPSLPDVSPTGGTLFMMVLMEVVIGLFYGSIARVFMTALDVAGMVISMTSSLSAAQIFNPGLATQGSLLGAFLSVAGAVFVFSTNLHHLLIMGVIEMYALFPLAQIPPTGDMARLFGQAISSSFMIGVQIGAPFIAVTMVIYVGMGVLSRLMPQVQVFILVLPVQILVSLILLMFVLSAAMMYWLSRFEDYMVFFLSG